MRKIKELKSTDLTFKLNASQFNFKTTDDISGYNGIVASYNEETNQYEVGFKENDYAFLFGHYGNNSTVTDGTILKLDSNNYYNITIDDDGPGIPEDEIPLVKKKFYKGSSKARGSGIGLAVCDEIVEMHGGQLILENAPGGGTLVTVQLPVSS